MGAGSTSGTKSRRTCVENRIRKVYDKRSRSMLKEREKVKEGERRLGKKRSLRKHVRSERRK